MTSEPRPCPDVDQPQQPTNSIAKKQENSLEDYTTNENAVIQNNLMVTQSIPVLPQETPAVTKPENQTQPPDGSAKQDSPPAKQESPAKQDSPSKKDESLSKQEFPLVKQQYPLVKPQHVLSSHDSAALPKDILTEPSPEIIQKDAGFLIQEIPPYRPTHPEVCTDLHPHPDVCSECGHDITPEPEKCSECGRVMTPPPKPNTCTECGQIIPPPPELCPQCGQTIPAEPQRCTECGQLMPRRWSLDFETAFKNLARAYESNTGCMFHDRWSRDGSSCHASTSRKLSQSSGDYDSDNGSHCSDCSCSSNTYSVICEKPCVIADSATFLQKSKWQAFRNYFRRIRRRKQIKCRKKDSSNKKAEDNVVTLAATQESNQTISPGLI